MRPSTRPKPLKRWTQTWRLNKLTKFVYVSVKKSETETETETERSVRASKGERERERERMGEASSASTDDDLLLKNFFAEVSEVERDNEVNRFSLSLSLSLRFSTFFCTNSYFLFYLFNFFYFLIFRLRYWI